MKSITEEDALIHGLSARCENLYYELEDIAFQLSGLIEKNDFDPVRLEQAENRLDQIRRIEKKYGTSADEVLQTEDNLAAELEDLNRLDDRLEQMGAEHRKLLAEYREAARRLTASRKALAEVFSMHMMQELQQLGMAQTVFSVHFEERTPDAAEGYCLRRRTVTPDAGHENPGSRTHRC